MRSFSVIIPCYGCAHYLRECVQSILTQRRVDVQVLIVDGASPDNTPQVARELKADSRVEYRRHPRIKGTFART